MAIGTADHTLYQGILDLVSIIISMTPLTMTNSTRLRLTVLGLFLEADRVLMVHQMTWPEPDCWDLPGGGLEPQETLMAGLAREIREETGIERFEVKRLLTVAESFFPEENDASGMLHTVNVIYQCRVILAPPEFHIDESEIGPQGIQWLPISSLSPDQCSSRSWQALEAAQAI